MKRPARPRLLRVPDTLLPLALALGCALQPGGWLPVNLYVAQMAAMCLSLFACRGVRVAFAWQPAIRAVRGSVKCALLLTLAGRALAAGAVALYFKGEWTRALPVVAAGCLLNIEHIFYEYMYAINDRRSAAIARGLTAVLTLAGLLLADGQPLWLTGATAVSALVALVIALVMGDGTRGRLNAAVLRAAPRAAAQTALYPAVALAAILILKPERYALAFFVGLSLYELCKTPFRRSEMEAREFNRALLIVMGVCALGTAPLWLGLVIPAPLAEIPAVCAALLLAAVCALILFGNVGKGKSN